MWTEKEIYRNKGGQRKRDRHKCKSRKRQREICSDREREQNINLSLGRDIQIERDRQTDRQTY
jgi:hypothetical protein